MAKELVFKLGGADYGAAPVKLERKKIYGWTDTVATDKDGNVCGSAYLSPDDALVIPSVGLQQATVDSEGCVDGDKYALILRLTNMELKSIE